jgi:hypothetical protein
MTRIERAMEIVRELVYSRSLWGSDGIIYHKVINVKILNKAKQLLKEYDSRKIRLQGRSKRKVLKEIPE